MRLRAGRPNDDNPHQDQAMTTTPTLAVITVLCFLGLLGWAMVSDARTMTIPNRIPVAIAILYAAWVVAMWPTVNPLMGLGAGGAVLVGGFVVFSFGLAGGGDVKLLASSALWAGPQHLPALIMVTAVAGGVLALAYLLVGLVRRHALRLPSGAAAETSLASLPIPYGVGIAMGAAYVACGLIAG
jgi:prepilin peptidase CpaA